MSAPHPLPDAPARGVHLPDARLLAPRGPGGAPYRVRVAHADHWDLFWHPVEGWVGPDRAMVWVGEFPSLPGNGVAEVLPPEG